MGYNDAAPCSKCGKLLDPLEGHDCPGRKETKRPVEFAPVVDMKLIALLERLVCLGNGDTPGNSIGNVMAQEALEMAKNPPYAMMRESGTERADEFGLHQRYELVRQLCKRAGNFHADEKLVCHQAAELSGARWRIDPACMEALRLLDDMAIALRHTKRQGCAEEVLRGLVGPDLRVLESSDTKAFDVIDGGVTIQMYSPDWTFGVASPLLAVLREFYQQSRRDD